ncbi:hypothetical protein IQ25_04134 [Novosphingobium taihuense]|nr:hypothetical protein IQ25_04134 [Novosphingobium taihuense]
MPLDVDIAALPVDAIEAVSARLNDTPRKCLEYRTPRERYSPKPWRFMAPKMTDHPGWGSPHPG